MSIDEERSGNRDALSDGYLTNMGPVTELNPLTSALLKPPVMAPHERRLSDRTELFPYDDVGAFNISNPAALIDGAPERRKEIASNAAKKRWKKD